MKQEDLETIVFRVVDRTAFGEMIQHHLDGTPICGLIPIMLASGDRVTVPGEIVEQLADVSTLADIERLRRCSDQYLESL